MIILATVMVIGIAVVMISIEITKTSKAANDHFGEAREVHFLVNVQRTNAGLSPLIWSDLAGQRALNWSETMAETGQFVHSTNYGCDSNISGENIFMSTGYASAKDAVRSWMNSPDHKANILREEFTHEGIGIVVAENGSTYYTQQFC